MPLDSGSNAFNNTNRVANDPANARAFTVTFGPRPIPASLSQTNLSGTALSPASNRQCPASRSAVVRDGIIVAVMNRENDDTITNTGGDPTCT